MAGVFIMPSIVCNHQSAFYGYMSSYNLRSSRSHERGFDKSDYLDEGFAIAIDIVN